MFVVMLVEIPDPEVILGVITAFLIGIFSLFIFTKIRFILRKERFVPSQIERLDYYEKQLIDLKIRLDVMNIKNLGVKSDEDISKFPPKQGISQILDSSLLNQEEIDPTRQPKITRLPNMGQNNTMDYVLGLITEKSMTSHDIQITLGRTREHTSRLMKKLFEEGYVERNSKSKPYIYFITDKGKHKLGVLEKVISTHNLV